MTEGLWLSASNNYIDTCNDHGLTTGYILAFACLSDQFRPQTFFKVLKVWLYYCFLRDFEFTTWFTDITLKGAIQIIGDTFWHCSAILFEWPLNVKKLHSFGSSIKDVAVLEKESIIL